MQEELREKRRTIDWLRLEEVAKLRQEVEERQKNVARKRNEWQGKRGAREARTTISKGTTVQHGCGVRRKQGLHENLLSPGEIQRDTSCL